MSCLIFSHMCRQCNDTIFYHLCPPLCIYELWHKAKIINLHFAFTLSDVSILILVCSIQMHA